MLPGVRQHFFGFPAHRLHIAADLVQCNNGRFVYHDPFTARENERISRAEIDGKVGRK